MGIAEISSYIEGKTYNPRFDSYLEPIDTTPPVITITPVIFETNQPEKSKSIDVYDIRYLK